MNKLPIIRNKIASFNMDYIAPLSTIFLHLLFPILLAIMAIENQNIALLWIPFGLSVLQILVMGFKGIPLTPIIGLAGMRIGTMISYLIGGKKYDFDLSDTLIVFTVMTFLYPFYTFLVSVVGSVAYYTL